MLMTSLILLKKCHVTKFADDSSLLIIEEPDVDIQNIATEVLIAVKTWFSSNKLIMKETKTNIVHFHNFADFNHQINILINDVPLHTCDNMKFLGLYIDCKLNWAKHIEYLCGKLSTGIFVLRMIRDKIET
jgi:hypothetical protein